MVRPRLKLAPEERYHRYKRLAWFVQVAVSFVSLSSILFTGLGRLLPVQPALYLFLVHLILTIASLPIDLYSGYILEKRFGLSRQSLGRWALDELKKATLALAFFLGTSFFFLWSVSYFQSHWWIVLGAAWFVFSVTLTTLFPVLLIPLFFPCKPLREGALKQELLQWCEKLGLRSPEIFEIALSRKTVKANASVTGFGRTRRVLLADTLLDSFTPEEIRMVLSHEIGHHVKGHLWRGIFFDLLLSFAAFYLLFHYSDAVLVLARTPTLSDVRTIPALSLISLIASLVAMPIKNGFSRMMEREADRYAWQVYPDRPVFQSLMNKLSAQNLTRRSIPRWEEWLWSSHPSTERRIALSRRFFERHPC